MKCDFTRTMDQSNEHYKKIFTRPIRDGVLRVLKNPNQNPSMHKIDLRPSKNADLTILHIPHNDRSELLKRFRVIKEQEKPAESPMKNINPEKETNKETIWDSIVESGKLLFTAGGIFAALFMFMNYAAFAQNIEKWLYPEKLEAQQNALASAIQQTPQIKPELLPTAGIVRENRNIYPPLSINIAPLENRIIIPKIGKNIKIVEVPNSSLLQEDWKKLEKEIQEGLKKGVVRYPGTAIPGQEGNVFITGHSSYYPWDDGKYKDVFALLHDLNVGDEFTVFWEQKQYNYRIRERKVVSPKDTSALDQPKQEKIATLMTCTPLGTAKNRLILVADQI